MSEMTIEQALEYLVETDELYGEAKGLVKGLDKSMKVTEAVEYLKMTGTGADKKSKALASQEYQDILKRYEDAVMDMEIVGTKRETIALRIEVWRTKSANRRSGNI